MHSFSLRPGLRRVAPVAVVASTTLLAACNALFNITEGEPKGAGGTGSGTSSQSASATASSSSTGTGMGGSGGATSTASSSASSASGSSTGTGSGMPACDGSDPQGPTLKQAMWSRRTAGGGTESMQATAIGADGSVYTAGFYDTADTTFSLQDLPWNDAVGDAASDQRNVFVAHFGIDGKFGWAHGFTGLLDQTPLGMTLDPAGDLLVVGRFEGSMVIDANQTLTAQGLDVFVLKLAAADGKVIWAKRFGGAGDELGQQVAADSKSDVIFAGMTNDVIDFGCATGASIPGQGAFLVKLASADGSCVWSQKYAVDTRFGGKDDTGFPVSLAVDRHTDDLYMAGGAASPNFGQGPKMSYGGKDAFVLKVQSDGSYVDAQVFGALSDDGLQYAGGVAVDPCGDVVMVGSFTHSLSFGPTTLQAAMPNAAAMDADHEDIFLAKLDSKLTPIWAKSFGDAGWQYGGLGQSTGGGVWVDAHSNITFAGTMTDTADSKGVDFGGGLKHGPGADMNMNYGDDIYLARFTADGKPLWGERFGTKSGQRSRGIAADDKGHVAFAGDFYTDQGFLLNFGGTAAPLQGVYIDGFLVELGP